MLKAILFDLDGVILDSLDMWQQLGPNFIRSLGLEAEENLDKILYSLTSQAGYRYLKESYHLSLSMEEIEEKIRERIQAFYLEEPILKEGIPELLSYLRREEIPCFLCTQTPKDLAQGALEVLNLDSYFQKIWSTDGRTKGKEDPEIFQEILQDQALKGPEVLLIEDSLFAIETAKTLGIQSLYIKNSKDFEKRKDLDHLPDNCLQEGQDYLSMVKRILKRSH